MYALIRRNKMMKFEKKIIIIIIIIIITKLGSSSKQFMSKLFIDNELILTVKIGKSFKFLGRYYNYDMDDEEYNKNILETTRELSS